tara:strand:+ start:513 stop:1394 length:882 start_codon:yes stop_codon:yes gene_type:complete
MNNFWKKTKFNQLIMKNYDFFVNHINCKYVWECDQRNIIDMYKKNIRSNHVEIGPGTGYFLKEHKFNNLTLIDVNRDILLECKKNLEKNCKNINIINKNVFEKNNKIALNNYDSLGINYVLHCVPNNLSISVDNLINNIPKKNYKIFGSTVIPNRNTYNLASLEIFLLNKMKIFNNKTHTFNDIESYVKKYLNYEIRRIGNSCLFEFETGDNSINHKLEEMITEIIENRIRPGIMQDGGDISYVGFDTNQRIVYVKLLGACIECPSSSMTLKYGVENMLKHYIPEITSVELME